MGKNSEINRQTFVIWWLNSRRVDLSDIYLAEALELSGWADPSREIKVVFKVSIKFLVPRKKGLQKGWTKT